MPSRQAKEPSHEPGERRSRSDVLLGPAHAHSPASCASAGRAQPSKMVTTPMGIAMYPAGGYRVHHWRADKIGVLIKMSSKESSEGPSPEIPEHFMNPLFVGKLTREIHGIVPAVEQSSAAELEAMKAASADLHCRTECRRGCLSHPVKRQGRGRCCAALGCNFVPKTAAASADSSHSLESARSGSSCSNSTAVPNVPPSHLNRTSARSYGKPRTSDYSAVARKSLA